MNIFRRLRLRGKLSVLVGMFVAGFVAVIVSNASSLHDRMLSDRVDKLKTVVDMALNLGNHLEDQVKAGKLTQDQMLAELRDKLHAMRFDNGDGYLTLQRLDGVILIHVDPRREGKPSTAVDSNGKSIQSLMADAVRTKDAGTIDYLFPKPGQSVPLPKVSYVARFEPMDGVFLAGAYVDDLDQAFHDSIFWTVGVGGAILLAILGVAFLVNRDIAGSLVRLKDAMAGLADGKLSIEVPGRDRSDEVGEMAAAVQIFKDNAIRMEQIKAEQQAIEERAAAEKKRSMGEIAQGFESRVGAIVEAIASSVTGMQGTAGSMESQAERAASQVRMVATASEQASTNIASVASAAEELSGSVSEISRQVTVSSGMAAKAVKDAMRASELVNSLAAGAQKIGMVTSLINEIASQTNLLALNATIEAARAGDAGKGFAVVASEVKGLASQTAKATEEISGQINTIQSETSQTVVAIQTICSTIEQLSETATAISAAVEQQGAATAEIAASVQQVAVGTKDVSDNIGSVAQVVDATESASGVVMGAAGELSKQADNLRSQVARFLSDVRAA
jgi:methyl-accepting chemotaxis protein